MIDWLKTNLMVIIFVGVPGIIVLIGIMKGVRNKLQQRLEVDKELTDNESTTSSKNFLKKLSIKRIAKWAFLIFLAIQAVAWILDMPQLFVVKKLVDIAYRNDSAHVSKRIGQRVMEEELKPYREEQKKIRSKSAPNQEDFARSKELERKIVNIEAKYDSVNKNPLKRRISAGEDVWFVIKYQDEKSNEKIRQMKARIEKLDENVLEVSYQSKCVGQGWMKCSYFPEQERWTGTWQDAEGGGDVILEIKDVGLVGYINNDPATRVWIKKS